jgi:hypothetical protein
VRAGARVAVDAGLSIHRCRRNHPMAIIIVVIAIRMRCGIIKIAMGKR